MISSKEISIVVQGAVNTQTPECLKSIREYLPDAEIILATYIGSDINGLDYDEVVLVEDPGFYLISDCPHSKKNNINRQILTTFNGLKTATRKYAFKLRSDFAMTGYGFLDYFDKFPKSDPDYKVFKHKILSPVFFAYNPHKRHPFHPSDIAFFGLREDLLNLFDIPLMTKNESIAYKVDGYNCCQYAPEQYILIKCLLKNGKDINCKHQRDVNDKNAIDSEKYIASNFIYLDWKQFSLNAPFHLKTLSYNNFGDVITHIEWQTLYKQHIDTKHETPNRDDIRSRINLFKCYRVMTNIVAFLIPCKKIRKRVRRKILKNIVIS